LAWLLDMSRKEKEEYVIRLYKENRSLREIAKIMHMSFRDIEQIINKLKEEIERGYMIIMLNRIRKLPRLFNCFQRVRPL
jgi:DNA-directed RNA polymerase specialized sigma24 family protein